MIYSDLMATWGCHHKLLNQSPTGDEEAAMPILEKAKAKPAIFQLIVGDPGPLTGMREWENQRFERWGWVDFHELQEITGKTGTEIMKQYGDDMYNGWWFARYQRRWNHPLLLALVTETLGYYHPYVWGPEWKPEYNAIVERITFVPAGWALLVIEGVESARREARAMQLTTKWTRPKN